ncbi:hypothetical protein BpOF4_21204 (plasmid) [Alkalihalophilus pseudofirmus OF4]|uniref:DUF3221 domain-containing protein n=1 Tax=Alkalihalophilus pseudofirmus (strain ATCC BAA-2126 / JCM 17055 / OF4) TaxID=398511 RepID=D3G1L0_ALKPO|nr:hypothetical protein [Alkalihalophilus pseudofirmus]ADC52236.1 hypothetical protein BpOF4_21204 [Alkalihalophilus pseudofirmus OF4]
MRKITILLALLLLFGCSEKTAEQQGEGISIEMGDVNNIQYLGINVYVDGLFFNNEYVFKDEGESSFKTGEIIWFEGPIIQDRLQEVEVIYSRNKDGSDSATTNKIDITDVKEWANTKLNSELELELLKYD